MDKEERLNIRLKSPLKRWFKKFASNKGGMSQVVVEHIENLKERTENGSEQPQK